MYLICFLQNDLKARTETYKKQNNYNAYVVMLHAYTT